VVNFNDTVQVVVNNDDVANHPFHLHGHHFQVLYRAASGAGYWSGKDENYANNPPMRDTVTVMPHSYVVLRFKATNPGVWLFHCHIEWHVEMGLTATVIEAPDRLRNMTFPDDHINACKKMGTPYQGNAAGNTQNATDTTGFITVPPTTYNGCVAASVLFLFYFSFGHLEPPLSLYNPILRGTEPPSLWPFSLFFFSVFGFSLKLCLEVSRGTHSGSSFKRMLRYANFPCVNSSSYTTTSSKPRFGQFGTITGRTLAPFHAGWAFLYERYASTLKEY
jgi:hypothetical protein